MSTETSPPRRPQPKRKITAGLAAVLAAGALLLGIVIGYAARGGPATPALVTTQQELPQVTVTVDPESP